jgi:HSP20 family protein
MFELQRTTPERSWSPGPLEPWWNRNGRLEPVSSGSWSMRYGATDLIETGNAVIVRMTLPGFGPDDLAVQEQQGVLTIRAEQRAEQRGAHHDVYYAARQSDFVQRSFRLPAAVAADRAEATLRNGVLTIRLPKAQTSRARRITIQPSKRPVSAQRHARSWLERATQWLRRPHMRWTQRQA